MPSESSPRFAELVGIYHAEGSLLGELRYLIGKLRGTAHCALCDISHGALTEKAEFKDLRSRLEVPLRMIHLDERDPDLVAASEGRTPCVLGRTEDGWELLLDATDLERCGKSVTDFETQLRAALG